MTDPKTVTVQERIAPSVYRTRCICDAYEAGDKLTDIAAQYGITKQRVEAIVRAKGLKLRYAPKRLNGGRNVG